MPYIMKELTDFEEFEKWKKAQAKKKLDLRYPLFLLLSCSWSFAAGYLFAIWK